VEEKAVISAVDADDIYKIPLMLHEPEQLDEIVCDKLRIDAPPPTCPNGRRGQRQGPAGHRRHRMVGKYVDLKDSYKSLNEALIHAGIHTRTGSRSITSIPSSSSATARLPAEGMDAILVPGGFGERGIEGKIAAVRYARENGVPYLGICLGMQVAVIEFARTSPASRAPTAPSSSPARRIPVIALITEWLDRDGRVEQRSEGVRPRRHHAPGRPGVHLIPGTLAHSSTARQHHRAPPPPLRIQQQLPGHAREKAGLVISGRSEDGSLVEVVELPDHPWFVACQFHPEFTSTPRDGHPLFTGFIVRRARRHEMTQNKSD
jgi:CTP synthase